MKEEKPPKPQPSLQRPLSDPSTWKWKYSQEEGAHRLIDPVYGILAYVYRTGNCHPNYNWELVGGERRGRRQTCGEAKEVAVKSVYWRYVLGHTS